MSGLRSLLYRWGRLLGDANAISRGPTATAKRYARKQAYKVTGKTINKIFR